MPIRKANAEWKGTLRDGQGQIAVESGAFKGPYSFRTRFEDGKEGTNPEELIGGAHAGCFSMALSGALTAAGHPPTRIATQASVHIEKGADGFRITRIDLVTEGEVPGIDAAQFSEFAHKAKEGCPVSRALAATEITLSATLKT
jgi:osmotically inducible protein OsmC